MLPRSHSRCSVVASLAGIALLAGCSTTSEPGARQQATAGASRTAVHNPPPGHRSAEQPAVGGNTGIDPKDLAATTEKMARSIASIGDLTTAGSAAYVVVVVENIRNETPLPIDEASLTEQVRSGLNRSAGGRLQFVNHEHMLAIDHDRRSQPAENGDPILGTPHSVDYQLVGGIGRLTDRSSRRGDEYVLYSFHLINLRTSEVVWEDAVELKKQDPGAFGRR